MGRSKTVSKHLPPLMGFRRGRYFYGRNQLSLGPDLHDALRKYADLHAVAMDAPTFAEASAQYLRRATAHLAPKTLREYERQLPRLVKWIGALRLADVRPVMVRRYLTERGNTVSATREKALLSAVFTFAREAGMYDGANPCAGVRGRKARRNRYVTDAELGAVLDAADPMTAAFLELAYLTGQRPADVLKITLADVREGCLHVQQGKTGAKVRIQIVGPLQTLIERLALNKIGAAFLLSDERGQRLTLSGIRKRFWIARTKAGADWQIRDLRAKAASDSETAKAATALLGHAAASTTDGYIRRVAGQIVSPILRATPRIAGKR